MNEIRILAVCALVLLPACRPAPVVPPQSAPAVGQEATLEIHVPGPSSSEAATLIVMRRGQDGYERVPTRIRGVRDVTIPLGEVVEFQVQASDSEMVRWTIDGHDYLVAVPPNAQLALTDNPCNGWELGADVWDANSLEPPLVRCVARDQACPDGFAPSPIPALADDPVCDTEQARRCVAMSTFTTNVDVHLHGDPLAVGEQFERGPTICDWTEVTYKDDAVRLLPAVAQRWTLVADNGRLRAVAKTRSQ